MRDAERTGGSAGRSRIQPSRHRPRASASPRSDPPASGAAASPRGQEPGSRARAPRGRTQPPSAADHHEPLQQGPFLRAFGRGQEQGAPGRGWGGAPATGRRRTALPPRSSALRPSAAEASKRRRAAACPHPVPGSRRPPRPLFWLCSCAAGRTSGGRGFPAPGVPPRAPGAAVSLVAAGRAPPGRGRSYVVTHP